MEYGKIEGLDKKVSRIVFGAAHLPNDNPKECFKQLDDMYSLGINVFDTAAVYGGGVNETVLINWVADRAIHDDVIIISKCAHHNRFRKRANSFDIMSDISDALAKPGADYIDIYLMHRDDPSVQVSSIIDTMNRLYESGKVKVFGVSNWRENRVIEANEYAYKHGLMPFSAVSPQFGLAVQVGEPWSGDSVSLGTDNAETYRKYILKNNIPVFSYSSLGGGFLSGKFKSNDIQTAKTVLKQGTQVGYFCEENFERLRRAEEIAKKKNTTVPVVSLAWVLNQEINTFPIISVSNKKRMEENIKAFDINLTKEEVDWMNLK
ncbi:MAG: aldo/keto reductase [Clostridia bacterium]